MTTPGPQQLGGRMDEKGTWVPPPLEPLEIAAVASIFVLLGALLLAKNFDPAPREASRNVRESLGLVAAAAPIIFTNWKKFRADLPAAAPLGFVVLYLLFSVWLGNAEPHRMIPWYLSPIAVFLAVAVGVLIGTIVRARHVLSARR